MKTDKKWSILVKNNEHMFCLVLLMFQNINVPSDDIEISLFDELEINRVQYWV